MGGKIVKMVRAPQRHITVEDGRGFDGSLEVWVRHNDMPTADALLATIHYDYAYQDNCARSERAEQIRIFYQTILAAPTQKQEAGE